MSSAQFWECHEAFASDETERAMTLLRSRETNMESFTPVENDAESEWLFAKMLSLAQMADSESGWGLLEGNWGATDVIYDRFGPDFSAVEFKWHVDAMASDKSRKVSVVAYLTDRSEFEGGILQIKLPPNDGRAATKGDKIGPGEKMIERAYGPGACVAFPSSSLWHNVTPVRLGQRRSLLLIAGDEPEPPRLWAAYT